MPTIEEIDDAVHVHLGFSIPIANDEQLRQVGHRSADYSCWDGGQLGGRPSWLEPQHLPASVTCRCCQNTMRFIAQIYAPIDDLLTLDASHQQWCGSADRAFHRSLYVFACSSCPTPNTGAIRVLRSQLPRENPYYPAEEENDAEETDWNAHLPETYGKHLCAVCGLAGAKRCPLQNLFFCNKNHQREHKTHVFDAEKMGEDVHSLPSLYPLSELVVEEEPDALVEQSDHSSGTDMPSLLRNKKEDGADDKSDSDEDIEQNDLNAMTGARQPDESQNPTTQAFYDRIKSRPNVADQCLRYERWNDHGDGSSPLWIRQGERPGTIPPCARCQAPRKFEFQLMPQLLHFLLSNSTTSKSTASERYAHVKQALEEADSLVRQAPPEQIPPSLVDVQKAALSRIQNDLLGSDGEQRVLDWGVVAVYTCTNSCGELRDEIGEDCLGAYREEFAWRQTSLDA
jgi:pre-rRNA-processing protein TSR4